MGEGNLAASLADTRRDLAEARRQLEYYRNIARETGRARLRDIQQLTRLVSERKRAEQSLAAERSQLLSIFDSIDEAVYVCDPNSREVLYTNRKVRELFGDVDGRKCHQMFHDNDDPCSFCTNDRIFGENLGKTHIWEFENKTQNRWYRCIEQAIRWPDGRHVRCEIAIDITESRRLAEEILLRQKLESVGRLAGGIAHDFNNILTGIMGNVAPLEVADTSDHPEAPSRLIRELKNACGRARDLNNQLLTFSAGGAPVKEAASLELLVRETADFSLRGSNVKAQYRLPSGLWDVDIDRPQISQVVQNLVMNADQAMPEGGAVEISAENVRIEHESHPALDDGRYVRLCIRDHGIGIPQEHLDKIFDPYFTTKPRGHGLGLATSYSIVDRHGGHITAASGDGATFVILLPASIAPAKAPAAATAAPTRGTGRVLVMDDEEIIRFVARGSLEILEYTFAGAADGDEAIRLYSEALAAGDPFRAVIMDLTVPGGMGGLQALERIRELDPGVRAIASSGYSFDQVMGDYERAGFRGVLQKPYDVNDLSRALQQALTADV